MEFMKIKFLISVVLFYLINYGLWDYIVLFHNISPEWASFYVTLILVIIIGLLHGKRILDSFRAAKDRFKKPLFLIKSIVLPMLIGYAGSILLTYLATALFKLDILPQNTENIKQVQDTIPLALTFLMMTVFAPIIEESVFRESFLAWVDRKKRPLFYIMTTLSVIFFAGIHVNPFDLADLVSVFYYLPLSAALTYIYLKNDGEVATSIVAHSVTNLFGFIFMLVGML